MAPAATRSHRSAAAALAAGRQAARAEAAEVARLLAEAGRPELIAQCIGMDPAEVRRLLDTPSHDEPRASASDIAMRRALAEAARDPETFWGAALDRARSGARPG
jgi:hypothetical protein